MAKQRTINIWGEMSYVLVWWPSTILDLWGHGDDEFSRPDIWKGWMKDATLVHKPNKYVIL